MSIDTGTLVALERHWETSLISSANDFEALKFGGPAVAESDP